MVMTGGRGSLINSVALTLPLVTFVSFPCSFPSVCIPLWTSLSYSASIAQDKVVDL